MILNKLVFSIKADLKFVEGSIPQGYLTANNINKDMFYVISPTVEDTIISANFQNNVLNAEPVKVEFTPSSLKVSELVSENESYYELVKDWNVWQGFMPSKPLEYVAYNRAGEIGISFNFKQLLVPAIPHGLEVKGFVEQEDFVPTEDGVYVVKVALYEYGNMEFTYHDLLIKVGNDVIRKGAMTQSGNTGSVEYAVDPSVYNSEYESIDPSLTESILSKLGENSADIKLLRLKFINYYTIVDNLTSTDTDKPLSANQGRVLKDRTAQYDRLQLEVGGETHFGGYTYTSFCSGSLFQNRELYIAYTAPQHNTTSNPTTWGKFVWYERLNDGSFSKSIVDINYSAIYGGVRDVNLSISRDGQYLFMKFFTNAGTVGLYGAYLVVFNADLQVVNQIEIFREQDYVIWGNTLQTPSGYLISTAYRVSNGTKALEIFRSKTPVTTSFSGLEFEIVATLTSGSNFLTEATMSYWKNKLMLVSRSESGNTLYTWTDNLEGNNGWQSFSNTNAVVHAPVCEPYQDENYFLFSGSLVVQFGVTIRNVAVIAIDVYGNITNPAIIDNNMVGAGGYNSFVKNRYGYGIIYYDDTEPGFASDFTNLYFKDIDVLRYLPQISRLEIPVLKGTTSQRPTIRFIGQTYFDTTLGREIVWNGTAWVELASLSVSNVFTQPQQVPNGTLPQHTVNKLQVETMFESELSQVYGGKNLAMPDLTGKEHLGNGVYRYRTQDGITMDYNIYNGYVILNGTRTSGNDNLSLDLYRNVVSNGTRVSFKYYFVSGTFDSNTHYTHLFANSSGTPGGEPLKLGLNYRDTIFFQNYEYNYTTSIPRIFLGGGTITFNNFTFRVQLEKGSRATPYTLPLEPVIYHIIQKYI